MTSKNCLKLKLFCTQLLKSNQRKNMNAYIDAKQHFNSNFEINSKRKDKLKKFPEYGKGLCEK